MKPTRTAKSFDGHWVCFSLPDMFLSQVSHLYATFSRRIDLARFRVGLLFSYRANAHNFSSAGCALTCLRCFWSRIETWKSRYIRSSRIPSLWIISTELYQTKIRALLYIIPRFQARSRYFDLWYCRQKGHRVSKIRTPVKRLRYKVFKILVLKFHSFIKLCFLLCSYSASSHRAEKLPLGRKVPIRRVPIGHKSSYWACSY